MGKAIVFGDAGVEKLVLGAGVDESTKSRNSIRVKRNNKSVLVCKRSGVQTSELLGADAVRPRSGRETAI